MNVKIFSLFVNLVVSSVLITQISLDYFSRQTVTSFELFKTSSTPGISFCFQKYYNLNINFKLPIKEILSSWNSTGFIKNVNAGSKKVHFQTTKFLRLRKPCVKLEFPKKSMPSPIKIQLNEDLVGEVNCLIHSVDGFPFGTYSALKLDRNDKNDETEYLSHVIGVRRTRSRKNSYFTNCKSSMRMPFEECYENCISNSSTSVLTSSVLSFEGDARVLTDYAPPTRSSCLAKCSKVLCDEETFEITTTPAKVRSVFKVTVVIRQPSNLITFIPKMSVEMFLIFITTIIGATFGFNVILFVVWIRRARKWIRQKYFRKRGILKGFFCRRVLTLVIYSLSFCGYLYQVLDITIDYANHEIIKETYLGPPYTKIAPALSICVDPTDLLKPNREPKQCKQLETVRGKYRCDTYLKNLTFAQLDYITEDIWSILLYMMVVPLRSKAIVIDHKNISKASHNPVSTFFKDNRKCFRIIPMDLLQTKILVYFTTKLTTLLHVYLHDARDYPRNVNKREDIMFVVGILIRYGYLLKTTQLLPAPYSSNCRVYRISRANCLENCVASTRTNTFPARIANVNSRKRVPTTRRSSKSETICAKRCHQLDCHLEEFDLTLNMQSDDPVWRELAVLTADLQLDVKWSPKIVTNDFLICLIATADLWAGLTLMSALMAVRKFGPLRRIRALRHLVTIIGGCLLVTGFTFHAISTIDGFLQRRVVSRTSVANARYQVAPCVAFTYNWGLRDKPLVEKTGNYSTKYLDKVTLDFDRLVKAIEIRNATTLEWHAASPRDFRLTTLFLNSFKFQLACHQEDTVFDAFALQSVGDTRVLRASLDEGGRAGMTLSTRQQSSFLKVTIWYMRNFLSASYVSYMSSLLPWPYASNCIDYASHGLQSRAICERRCTVDFIYRTKGYITIYVPREGNDTRRPISFEYEDEFWIAEECVRKCSRPDCEDRFLKPFLVSRSARSQQEFNIEVNIGTKIVETRMFPQQSLLEFIIFFSGLLGMWWGLSLHDAIRHGIKKLKKVQWKRKQHFGKSPDNSFMLEAVKSRVFRNSNTASKRRTPVRPILIRPTPKQSFTRLTPIVLTLKSTNQT